MYVRKKSFSVSQFKFDAGIDLPVTVGYETYGSLAQDKSNVILICHYFSGTSHAGGKGYELHNSEGAIEKIEEPGWWSPLIGPGLPFDTDRYFIICMDVISNVNVHHPLVITTGPNSINPDTSDSFELDFPQVTIRDFVKLQKLFLDSLGISKLYCVAGPSMGGMQALQWAVDYPDMVERVIAVVTTGRTSAFTSVNPLQIGIDAILASPEKGISAAVKAMTIQAYSSSYVEKLWPYEAGTVPLSGEIQPLKFHEELNELVSKRVNLVDPYSWLYISRACQHFTLESGYESYEEALLRIKAKVLAIPSSSDLIFPASESKDLIEKLRNLGKEAYYREWEGKNGHIEAITNCGMYGKSIQDFLEDRIPREVIIKA